MTLFPYAHATHPQWQMAAALVLAQLRAQMALHGYADTPTLGLLYITDHYAASAREILEQLREKSNREGLTDSEKAYIERLLRGQY